MTPSSATLPDSSVPKPFTLAAPWPRLLAGALIVAGVSLAWTGGVLSLLGCALLLGASWLHRRGGAAGPETSPAPRARAAGVPVGGRHGAEVMVSEVVPVWSRQMEVTRDAATDGLAQILNVFTQMSDALHTLTQNLASFEVSAQPGAVDQAVRRESPALDALTAASSRAFAERDAVVAELGRCADALSELQHLAKQTREIGRHTRLVAFNASIEANRTRAGSPGGSADGVRSGNGAGAMGGAQAVANELRVVATRMAEVGERVEKVVLALQGAIRKARHEGEIGDTKPDELRLEIDLQARQALQAMLGAMGASLQGSEAVQQASHTLRDQLDEVFVHFQFGDRVSQMMSIVANDMSNFARWVAENPRATQTDATEWLTALEASYTMDEQRSSHHGNVHVDQSSGVEFF